MKIRHMRTLRSQGPLGISPKLRTRTGVLSTITRGSHHLRILGKLKTDWTLPKTTIQTPYSFSSDLDRELIPETCLHITTWNVYKVWVNHCNWSFVGPSLMIFSTQLYIMKAVSRNWDDIESNVYVYQGTQIRQKLEQGLYFHLHDTLRAICLKCRLFTRDFTITKKEIFHRPAPELICAKNTSPAETRQASKDDSTKQETSQVVAMIRQSHRFSTTRWSVYHGQQRSKYWDLRCRKP